MNYTICQIPFYRCLDTDKSAYELMQAGLVDKGGRITKEGEQYIDPSQFELDPTSIRSMQGLFNDSIPIDGRCRKIPMQIEITPRECALKVDEAAQKEFNSRDCQ